MNTSRVSLVRLFATAAVAMLLAAPVFATTLVDPTTGGGLELGTDFPSNGWTLVQGSANRLWVGATAVPSAGTNSAFSGVSAASWTGELTASVNHFYRDVTFPVGEGVIKLSFKYKIAAPDATFDLLKVFLVPTSTTPVAGTQLTSGQVGTTIDTGAAYTTVNISLSASNAGTTQRLVFSWKTDSAAPAAAVSLDEISVTSQPGTISGTKTVCPSGCDYATLTAAFADLNANGLAGPVVLELQSTYVSTSETYPLAPGAIPAASATNTVTIQPALGATALSIGSSNTTATIDMAGSSFVTWDGQPGGTGGIKQLTIENTSTTGTAMRFINEASNNTVRFCTLRGVNTSTTNGVVFFSTTTGSNGNDNNTITSCDIRDGATTPNNGVYSAGSTTTAATNNSGNTISNNNIFNFFNATASENGIFLSSGNSDWTITGNSIYQTASRTETSSATESGITISSSAGNNFVVTNNFIGGTAPSAGGTAWTIGGSIANRFRGISLSVGSTTASSVQGNTIANFNFTSNSSSTTAGGPWTGIYLTTGNANIGNVTGNTIGSGTGNGSVTISVVSNSGSLSSGIFCDASSTVSNISNNTIGSISFGASTISQGFQGISTTSGTTLTINNNTIGSTATANSINVNTGATATTAQIVRGINNTSTATISITNNTIANLTNSYLPGSAVTSNVLVGILNNASSGAATITGNTVRNLTTAANATGTSASASAIGIASTSSTAPLTISSNAVREVANNNATAAVIVTGIFNSGPTSGTNAVAKNVIHTLTNASTAGIINGINVTAGTTTFSNNMIDLGNGLTNSAQINGVNEPLGNGTFYHNSIYIGGSGVASGAVNTFAFNSTVTTNVRNYRDNIFFNARSNASGTGTNYAMQVGGSAPNPSGLTSNNNVLFANGTGAAVGRFNAATQLTLANWQTATGQDALSYSSDPQYLDPTNATPDLHISPTLTTVIEGNGADVGVVEDFDSQTRSGLTPVDIGADAGNFVGLDLQPPAITYTPLVNTTSTADRNLTISVTDPSGVPTAGAGLPVLYFRKGIAGAYSASQCSLVSGSSYKCTFTYASVGGVVAGDKIQYYVAAQDTANNTATNPSAGAGGFTANPPAAGTPPTTPNSYNVAAAITGNKTVCASGCDYTSLTNTGGAFESFNNGVFTGDTTLEINDNLTGETGSVALNQWAEEGTGGYTLKLYPTGGARSVTGTGTGTTLMKLNGADRVTIDGSVGGVGTDRSLTLNNTNTANGTGVLFIASLGTGAGATNNTVKNCLIRAGNIGTTANFTYGIFVGDTGGASAGADNDNLTIQNNQINLARTGIQIVGTAAGLVDNAQILDNLVGDNTVANSIGRIGVLVSTANAATISGNTIKNLFLSGDTSSPVGLSMSTLTNSTVSQNSITSVQSSSSSVPAGMTLATASTGNVITQNTIDGVQGNVGATGDPVGLSLGTGVTTSSVTRNTIRNVLYLGTGGYGGRGINIDTGNASSSLTLANNSVSNIRGDGWSTFSSDSIAGIRIVGTTGGINLYFNSVNLGSGTFTGNTSGTLSAALYVASTVTALNIRDNVFATNLVNSNASTAKSYAIYSDAPNTAFTDINYNDYFASGTQGALGFLSTARTTLAAWQTATGKDANSLAADPLFNTATNLQPQLGSPLLLAGTPAGGITVDLVGTTRDVATPTIGAYETAADLAAPIISYSPLLNTTSTSSRTLATSVTDVSGVPTSGIGLPVVYFRKGSTDPYVSSQCVFMGGSTYNCLIDYSLVTGGSTSAGDTIQYYVAAQDSVGNVGTNPATGASGFTANPPAASTPPTPPSSYLVAAAINGSYAVGTGETITSLTNPGGLFEQINNGVLTGNVTADLTSDSTAETGAIALNQWAEEGGLGSFTLTIRPSGGAARVISGSAAAALIKLNGADGVTIDGLNTGGNSLSITNTNTASGTAAIWLASLGTGSGSTNNTIANTTIATGSNTANTWGICVGGSTLCANGADNDSNTIQGNTFNKALNGIVVVGTASTSSGAADGLSISSNIVGPATSGANNLGLNGILIANAVAPSLSGNTVSNVVSTTSTVAGIALNGGVTNAVVTRNTVSSLSAAASSTTTYGIFVGTGSTGAQISRNTVSALVQTNTGGYPARGIYVNTGTASSSVTLSNNFIRDIVSYSDPSTAFSFQPVGIMIDGTTGGVNLYHNSINLSGAHLGLTSATLQAALFVGASVTALDVRDNIFANSYDNSTSGTDKSYAVYSNAPASSFTNINYNDYFVSGTPGVLGFIGAADRTTLGAWQTATGQDANSVSADPLFISSADLHINISGATSPVENVGTPIAGVTIDFDGDTRSASTPDIGADEVDRCLNVTCSTNTTCASYSCNPSNGICDEVFAPITTECRVSSDLCDAAETCTGASAACPADIVAPAATVCRLGAGACDVAETCDGIVATCPADVLVPAATECRASGGDCDVAESCTGTNAACPADVLVPAATECRASGGDCDVAESCTGTNAACPADVLAPATTECRASGGDCDVAESCTGANVACPADVLVPAATECRTSGGDCDVAESCTGTNAACPVDVFVPAATECRTSGGICDVAESCTGTSASCPANLFVPDTTECRASTATCDPAEFCTGAGAGCPSDAVNMSDPVGNTVSVTHNTFTAISTISWSETNAGPFNVYRGGLISANPWSYNEGCFSSNVPVMSVSEFSTPAPGGSFFYLITRKTSSCTESNLGQRSNGSDRPLPISCPNPGPDTDGDTVLDAVDNCPTIANLAQTDVDLDAHGDVCDNCPLVSNSHQEDTNNNGIGDACDP